MDCGNAVSEFELQKRSTNFTFGQIHVEKLWNPLKIPTIVSWLSYKNGIKPVVTDKHPFY